MNRLFIGWAFFLLLSGCASSAKIETEAVPARWVLADSASARQIMAEMPAVQREFRAVWVATVDNIDWPSRPGLSTEEQKNEMRDVLDRAQMLNLNAVVLQIRPTADALYRSELEPWSYYLTGENGKAPDPQYDPLEFAVEEAHKRGMELHTWFNPYRAYHPTAPDTLAENHISKKLPDSVHQYGNQLWMDPGSPVATDHTLAVMMDVVERYDIDGVHMDDYFYPYPVDDEQGNPVPFPDSSFFAAHGDTLNLADWRRKNVDDLVRRIYTEIKSRKPWVLFGISPFGIWRPGYPEMVTGFDAYEKLYADAKKWLNEGWVDYYTPQLYWALESKGQPYGALLNWWIGENHFGRHMWPGLYTSRYILEGAAHWEPDEIVAQVLHTRQTPGATGNVHFSMRALMPSDSKLSGELVEKAYSEPAVTPPTMWLNGATPAPPSIDVIRLNEELYLSMTPTGETKVRNWIINTKINGEWILTVVPGWKHSFSLLNQESTEVIVVQALTRLGLESAPQIVLLK